MGIGGEKGKAQRTIGQDHRQARQAPKPLRWGGDGEGLYLNAAPSGAKSWVQRIVIKEKRCDVGLGSYPDVSLAQARSLAAGNRSAVAEGRDPLAGKREAKESARNPTPSVPTF